MSRIVVMLAIAFFLAPTLDPARAYGPPLVTPGSGDQAVGQQAGDPRAVQSMDVCGDSISKAFNGQGRPICPNDDQEQYNWATSRTHGAEWCSAGPEGVFSQAERIECLRSAAIGSANPNSASSGAQMLKDIVNQATAVKAWLLSQPGPRYVPILLARVSGEYARIPAGGQSAGVFIGGQWVGGAVKSAGVTVAYSDAPWRYKFTSSQLSCCDCYHPSRAGQNAASRILFDGLTCTPTEPCCRDTGDALLDGRCAVTDTDGRSYPGLFTPAPTATSQP